jgi:hypothetical protein
MNELTTTTDLTDIALPTALATSQQLNRIQFFCINFQSPPST